MDESAPSIRLLLNIAFMLSSRDGDEIDPSGRSIQQQ
jgi:hypothetical protein